MGSCHMCCFYNLVSTLFCFPCLLLLSDTGISPNTVSINLCTINNLMCMLSVLTIVIVKHTYLLVNTFNHIHMYIGWGCHGFTNNVFLCVLFCLTAISHIQSTELVFTALFLFLNACMLFKL